MQVAKRIIQSLAAAALACGLSLSAQAQIGTGWIPITVPFVVQTSAGCSVSGNTFKVPSGSVGRAERRYDTNTFTQRQFQGTVVVRGLGGDRVNIKQTFDQDNGPYNIIAVSKALNELYEVEGGNKLANYTMGSSIRINTIITRSTGRVQVYINSSGPVETKTGGSLNLYDKVGAYISGSGTGPCTTVWNPVNFWRK